MNEDTYEIKFKLLVPKFVLFRYDVFPFIFLYIALFYAYFNLEQTEDSNLSIYLRLALIGVGFLNCLAYIFGHWSKKMQAIIQYKTLEEPYENNLQKASHVYVYQKKQGYSPTHFISDFYKQEEPLLYFFHFLQKKYYYSEKSKTFQRLKPKLTNLSVQEVIHNGRYDTPRDFYDENILQIPIRQFGDIFREQIIDPFAFFQLFSVFLWYFIEVIQDA